MQKIDKILEDIEFKASDEYDQFAAQQINKTIAHMKNIGAPEGVIKGIQEMIRESFINGAKAGALILLVTVQKEIDNG